MILPERVEDGMKMNMVNDDVAFATPIPGLHIVTAKAEGVQKYTFITDWLLDIAISD